MQERVQGSSSDWAGLWFSGGCGQLEGILPQGWSLSRKGSGLLVLICVRNSGAQLVLVSVNKNTLWFSCVLYSPSVCFFFFLRPKLKRPPLQTLFQWILSWSVRWKPSATWSIPTSASLTSPSETWFPRPSCISWSIVWVLHVPVKCRSFINLLQDICPLLANRSPPDDTIII